MGYNQTYTGPNAYKGKIEHADKMSIVFSIKRLTKDLLESGALPDLHDTLTSLYISADQAAIEEARGNDQAGLNRVDQSKITFSRAVSNRDKTIAEFVRVVGHNGTLVRIHETNEILGKSALALVQDAKAAQETPNSKTAISRQGYTIN